MKIIDKGYIKARGLKANYNAEDFEDVIYFATDTLEIILNNKSYGGDIVGISLNILKSYTPETADTYTIEKHTEDEELQLTFTPLSPDSLKVPQSIGDITLGMTAESLKGRPLSQILDDIIFKTIYPTITEPTLNMVASTGTVEAGSTLWTGYSYTFNQGSVVVNDGVTATTNYVGAETSHTYYYTKEAGGANTNAGVSDYPAVSRTEVTGLTRYEPGRYIYTATVNYAAGPIMKTSKGATTNPMPTTNNTSVTNPHPVGSISTPTTAIAYRYVTLPVWIDSASGSYVKQALKTWGAMTFTGVAMRDTSAASPIKIKTPRKLEYVRSYNAVSGKYDVDKLDQFTMNLISETVNGLNYTYYEYTWTGSGLGAVNMEVKTY